MTRTGEAALLAAAATIAGFGVALVNLARDQGLDAQVALTFIVFVLAFGAVHAAIRAWAPRATPLLWPTAALIAAVGFTEVYRLDGRLAGLQRWWLLIAAALAVGLLAATRRSGLEPLRRYRYVLLFGGLVLLLMPLLPSDPRWPLRGLEVNGSRLWVRFEVGPLAVQFQPGELAKLAFVGFVASYLAERSAALTTLTRRIRRIEVPEPRQLVPLLIAWLASFAVLVYQRDLGASLLIYAVFVGLLYAATRRAVYPATGLFTFAVGAVAAAIRFDHVQRRISAWLDPFADFEGAGFQIAQSLFALASGGLTGSGPGLGRPDLIPNAATDFVFSAVGEELGLAGTVVVVCAYALLVGVGFGIAVRARDRYRKLLAAGLALLLGTQTIVILAGVTRLLPLTGVTLPLMSYGGSSLVSSFLLLALLSRISHEERA